MTSETGFEPLRRSGDRGQERTGREDRRDDRPGADAAHSSPRLAALANALRTIGYAIDGPVPVVRDQHRPVFHKLDIDRAADIVVVYEEPGDERFDRLDRPIRIELGDKDIATHLGALVPRSVSDDQSRVVVFTREHIAGIKAHAQRRRMRSEQRDWLGEFVTAVTPAELRIWNIASAAIR